MRWNWALLLSIKFTRSSGRAVQSARLYAAIRLNDCGAQAILIDVAWGTSRSVATARWQRIPNRSGLWSLTVKHYACPAKRVVENPFTEPQRIRPVGWGCTLDPGTARGRVEATMART
jgi:hypothetical protein